MSRSVSSPGSRLVAAALLGWLAMACTMGRISDTTVHRAAIPITPAPKKRTLLAQSWVARALRAWPSAGVVSAISQGTAMPQQITSPASTATPAAAPIKYPAAISAGEKPVERRNTTLPAGSQKLTASPSRRRPPLSKPNTAASPAPQPSWRRLLLPPWPPASPASRWAWPTRSTSAAATPSG